MNRSFLCLIAALLSVSHVLKTEAFSGPISVSIERQLPGLQSPQQAKDAWISYTFRKGGGLPGLIVVPEEGDSRLLLPLGAREKLVEPAETSTNSTTSSCQVQYVISEMGPIWQSELEENSHQGQVVFTPNENGVQMQWSTSCTAKNRRDFWEAVAKFMVERASDNLVAYLATPRVYQRRTLLTGTSPKQAMEEWVDFGIKAGGGLPFNPPLILPTRDDHVADIIRVPPFLRESVLSATSTKDHCEVVYQVMNPSIWTCFPVHSHLGRVKFSTLQADDSSTAASDNTTVVEMLWEVQVRPMHGWEFFVEGFTDAIVSTLSRNLKVHLAEPGATVKLYQPRGGGDSWAQVPKDSWLGGVLTAHLSDQRSTWEQTLSLLQPWTWGRTQNWDQPGEGASPWKTAAAE